MTSQTALFIEHEIGSHGTVSVRGFDGSIEIRAGDGTAVRLQGTGERDLEDDYRVLREPDGLLVEAVGTERFGLRWLRVDRAQGLRLEVPHGARVRIETASGSVHARGLDGDQHYRTVSGDIRLGEVGGRLVVDGVSGDVVVRAIARIDLEARVVSADIDASAPAFGVVRVKTTSGDLRLSGALAAGVDHTIETVSGHTTLAPAGPIQVDGRTISGDLRTRLPHHSEGPPGLRTIRVGEGGPHVSFRSISGGLAVVASGGPVAQAARLPADPVAPLESATPTPIAPDASSDDDARLAVLHDLEAGRIDVAEAGRRLAAIDGPPPDRPAAPSASPLEATESIPTTILEEETGHD